MPKGIPNDPLARKGGYFRSKDELLARIKEIEARIRQMDRREKALGDLKKWLAGRKLAVSDLAWMVSQMKPKRAAQPAKSKKPLQPPGKSNGMLIRDGRPGAAKGDPEFRRALREARSERGLTTEALGEKIGVSGSTISSWEVGRYVPADDKRLKVLKFLGLPTKLGEAASKAMEAARDTHRPANGA